MSAYRSLALALLATGATASSLASYCTVSRVQSSLPYNGTLLGIEILLDSVIAEPLYNQSTGSGYSSSSTSSSTTTYNYCSVNVTYTHTGTNDSVQVIYALPDTSVYANRFYVAGGGGYSLSTSASGGLTYGAAGGATGAGYGALDGIAYDDVVLLANGTINWPATYMFSYQALGEMTEIGQFLVKNYYNSSTLYTYYEGCSDGGREGMSQIQRYGNLYDGVITGAPAFRMAQQQLQHIFSAVVEHTLDYYPPPCALDKIVNATIAACDPLDGRTDGVISRTDLCQLQFNLSSIIGTPYACAAEDATSLGFGFSKAKRDSSSTTTYQPAQNGTVNAKDVEVAKLIYEGLHDSNGQRAYLSWQIGSQLADAATEWDNTTDSWALDIVSTGGEFVTKFVELLDLDNLDNLDGVTYDTVVGWMKKAYYRYTDSLQTTVPDLTTFKESGGKLIHFHGESDPSIPSASSVHYWQYVRQVMYGIERTDPRSNPMVDWYQFYYIPGAAHCGSNDLQPAGPYPDNNMPTMIDWVEHGIQPTRLNATASENPSEPVWELCQWPLRPLWENSSSTFSCVYDDAGYASWTYDFTAFGIEIF